MGWIFGALFMLALSHMNAELDAANAAMLAEPVGKGNWCYSCVAIDLEEGISGMPVGDGWPEEEE